MRIHAVRGSCISHPFWRAKFTLNSADDLLKIRDGGLEELWIDIAEEADYKLACNDAFVSKRTSAFEAQALAVLVSVHPDRARKTPTAKLEARVLDRTLEHLPKDGSTHWSSLKPAADVIGLCLDPPAHAAVVCVDDKTAIHDEQHGRYIAARQLPLGTLLHDPQPGHRNTPM